MVEGSSAPIVFLDFDGVLNAFPDAIGVRYEDAGVAPVVECRGRVTDSFGPEQAFRLDGAETVRLGRGGGTWRLHWSRELAAGLYELAEAGIIDLRWLSTWQPYARILDGLLGWDPDVVHNTRWYDPLTGRGRMGGKLHAVVDEVIRQLRVADAGEEPRPIVWIDDEEASVENALMLHGHEGAAPMLLVRPLASRGISRRQWACIRRFVTVPPEGPVVIYSDVMHEDGIPADQLHDTDQLPGMSGHRGL